MRRLAWVSAAFLTLTALSLGPLAPDLVASQRYGYRSYGYHRPNYRPSHAYRYRPHYRPYYRSYYRPYYRYYGAFRPFSYWPSFYASWGYPAPYLNVRYSYYAGGAVDYSYQNGSVKTKIEPKQTEIYVDGYYAGIADDFDGTFQRLYVPPGQHEILMRLDGYRTHRQTLHVNSGTTYKLHHEMEPLGAGETTPPPPQPPSAEHLPQPEKAEPQREPSGPQPPSQEDMVRESEPRPVPRPEAPRANRSYRPQARFGMLALRVQPMDAEVFIDGELWGSLEGLDRTVIHLPAGPHRIEIRNEGFQSFATEVEVLPGETVPLNVKLDGVQL